jgi:MFS superfamily sulfate permease-like transporter
MCVQPMKSIAAIALLTNMTAAQISGAGLLVSLVILFLGITQTVNFIKRYMPLCIIRGIQLGTGLTLLSKGIDSILKSKGWSFQELAWVDNFLVAMLAFSFVLVCYTHKRNYSAVLLFLLGIAGSLVRIYYYKLKVPVPQISFPTPSAPSMNDIAFGALKAGLGQMPLTLLNSVIAVTVLANDLFPEKKNVTITSVAISVGLMNMVGIWFGSVPYCHGSGGLAAQYRFGARSGLSIIFLGFAKAICGILFGSSLLSLFQQLPSSILGVMLIVAGMQLTAITVDLGVYESDEKRSEAYMVMILTAATLIGFGNDGIGFLTGLVAHCLFNLKAVNHRI